MLPFNLAEGTAVHGRTFFVESQLTDGIRMVVCSHSASVFRLRALLLTNNIYLFALSVIYF
jgi:hypothetical protein